MFYEDVPEFIMHKWPLPQIVEYISPGASLCHGIPGHHLVLHGMAPSGLDHHDLV